MLDFVLMDQSEKFARLETRPFISLSGVLYLEERILLEKSVLEKEEESARKKSRILELSNVQKALAIITTLPTKKEYGYNITPNDLPIGDPQREKVKITPGHAQLERFYVTSPTTFTKTQDYTTGYGIIPQSLEGAKENFEKAFKLMPFLPALTWFAEKHRVSVSYKENVAAAAKTHKKIQSGKITFKMRAETGIDQTMSYALFMPADKAHGQPSGYINGQGARGVFSSARLFETESAAAAYAKYRGVEDKSIVLEVETRVKKIVSNPGNLFAEDLLACLSALQKKELLEALEKSSIEELKSAVASRAINNKLNVDSEDSAPLKKISSSPKKRAM